MPMHDNTLGTFDIGLREVVALEQQRQSPRSSQGDSAVCDGVARDVALDSNDIISMKAFLWPN